MTQAHDPNQVSTPDFQNRLNKAATFTTKRFYGESLLLEFGGKSVVVRINQDQAENTAEMGVSLSIIADRDVGIDVQQISREEVAQLKGRTSRPERPNQW